MKIKCQQCGNEYNVYSITDEEDNIASSSDKYANPIFFNGKEYIGTRCVCGAINIVPKE